MKVYTYLSSEEYQKFKQKAQSLGISEFALAKEGCLIVTTTPITEVRKQRLLAALKEFFESGQEIP